LSWFKFVEKAYFAEKKMKHTQTISCPHKRLKKLDMEFGGVVKKYAVIRCNYPFGAVGFDR
jgi:hypothetical protein